MISFKVSYMIVDQADMQVTASTDPFLEAGIAIPHELPYKDDNQRDDASKRTAASSDEADSGKRGKSFRRKLSTWRKGSTGHLNVTPVPRKRMSDLTKSGSMASIFEEANVEIQSKAIK